MKWVSCPQVFSTDKSETPQQWAIQRELIEGDIRESLVLHPELERIDPDRTRSIPSQVKDVESMAPALRARGMRDGISLDRLSSLVGVTEESGVLTFPFAVRTAPSLWNTRYIVSNPKWSADDLCCASEAICVPFFPHAGVTDKQFAYHYSSLVEIRSQETRSRDYLWTDFTDAQKLPKALIFGAQAVVLDQCGGQAISIVLRFHPSLKWAGRNSWIVMLTNPPYSDGIEYLPWRFKSFITATSTPASPCANE